MGKVLHTKGNSGGGTGTGWSGQVEFRANLPITLGTPAIGEVYLVEKPTTILLGVYTTYQSGLYIRDFNTGALSDWRKLNVKVKFLDSEFAVVSVGDESKQAKLDISLLTTATTRTLQVPDKDGIIALTSDIDANNELHEILANGNLMFDGQTIIAQNGVVVFDPRFLGVNDQLALYTALHTALGVGTGSFLDLTTASGIQAGHITTFFNMIDNGATQSISAGSTSNFFVYNLASMTLQNASAAFGLLKAGFSKSGDVLIQDNEAGPTTTSNIPAYPITVASQNSTTSVGIVNTVSLGGKDKKEKTSDTAYINQLGFNTGLAGEMLLKHTPNAADFTATLQAASGTIAFTSDIDGRISGQRTDIGTAAGTNSYTLTLTPALTAYALGQVFDVLFTNACTATATLNINGLGAKAIKRNGTLATKSGDILAGQVFSLFYDGTDFQIIGRVSTDWQPPAVALGTLLSSGASFFINGGAGVYLAFDGASDDAVYFNDNLVGANGAAYDGSNMQIKLHCRISTNGGVGDTVGLLVDYGIVVDGDNSSTTVTSIAQQNVDVSAELTDIGFNIILGVMTGVVGADTLLFTLTRNATGAGADSYAGQLEVISFELLKA